MKRFPNIISAPICWVFGHDWQYWYIHKPSDVRLCLRCLRQEEKKIVRLPFGDTTLSTEHEIWGKR